MIETRDMKSMLEAEITGFSIPLEGPFISEQESPDMPVAYVVDVKEGVKLDDLIKQGLAATSIDKHLKGKMLVHDSRIEVVEELAQHEGSQFGYLGEMDWGEDRVLISFGKPHSKTSKPHWHLPKDPEFYKKLYGEANIRHHEGDQFGYKVPDNFVVHPGIRHQIMTNEEPVLFLLLMKNAAIRPPELRHIRD